MSNYTYIPPSRKQSPKVLQQFGIHIFYGEGTKTEPLYVEDMKKVLQTRYKMTASDIENIIVDANSGGRNTLSLVEYAEQDVERRVKNKEKIDHVWIFYDKDSFDKDNYDNSYFKITSKNKEEYQNDEGDASDSNYIRWHALWSNECFELWVLLHFQYTDSALSRKSYIPSINEILKNKEIGLEYEKNLNNLFQLLERHGSIKNAYRWAKKLNDRLPNPNVKDNPSTGIYELVEYFDLYMKLNLKT
jgi:hypothetical protein